MFIDKHRIEKVVINLEKPITIKDIAQEVGVSETTISRYLNKKYEYMSEKTRVKIEAVIKELDYRPNHMARSLKSQKSKMIGAVIADISNPFSSITIKGLSERCEEAGYTLLIAISDDSAEMERKQIENLIANQVDGLVINTSGDNDEYLNELNDRNFPIVLLDRGVAGEQIDTVTTNNYQGVRDMMEFLITTGYVSIGFFVDKLSNTVRKERLRGFEDALSEHQERIQGTVYTNPNGDQQMITESLADFNQYPKPRVIFGANGLMTSTILEVMNTENYLINEDFSICGFDDLTWAKVIKPELTTIYQDSYQLGAESVNQVIARIEMPLSKRENKKGQCISFPTVLKIRNSTVIK